MHVFSLEQIAFGIVELMCCNKDALLSRDASFSLYSRHWEHLAWRADSHATPAIAVILIMLEQQEIRGEILEHLIGYCLRLSEAKFKDKASLIPIKESCEKLHGSSIITMSIMQHGHCYYG
uniref:Ankyrin repeat protein n=1 Tax=Angiostrongylus cantonensis TaxID=6313 RepID=A0A0K0D7Q1_ANGCA